MSVGWILLCLCVMGVGWIWSILVHDGLGGCGGWVGVNLVGLVVSGI